MSGLNVKVRRGIATAMMTLVMTISLNSQTGLLPSTLSLSATPSPLVLPGALTLTSTANATPVAGGVPTGSINFAYDGSNSLGTAPLKILSATQAFPSSASATLSSFGISPVGVVSLSNSAQPRQSLVGADAASNVITLYSFLSSISTPTTNQYQFPVGSPGVIDAIRSGYFLNPKSTGIQSVLVHLNSSSSQTGQGSYSVFDGSITTAGTGALLNPPAQTSTAGCNCSNPDDETIAIDDFDGDGYSDVAALVAGTANLPPTTGITLNAGALSPGSFPIAIQGPIILTSFIPAPLPSGFCAGAIATGQFATSTGAQLAVLGKTPVSGNCLSILPSDPSSILIFALSTGNTQLALVSTTPTDATASTLAAADLNGDGKTDLIIGESTLDGVKVAFGNGDGSFMAPSPLVNTLGAPVSLIVDDFNADGHPDVAMTLSSGGGLAILMNDGTGNFRSVLQPFAVSTPVGLASGDLNGDGLTDLAVLLPSSLPSADGSIDLLINSAASQATLTTATSPMSAGTHTLTSSYAGDANFSGSTSAILTEDVVQTIPLISWPAPAPILYGTPLSSAQLDATASVNGTFSYSTPLGTILNVGNTAITATFTPVDTFDYAVARVTQSIQVNLPPATVTVSAPTTTATGENPTINLTVNPYPDPVTATVTLSFVPAPPNTVGDPMIVFANNTTAYSPPVIPANTPAVPIPITFQSGSTAGVITVTTRLVDNVTGADVTPTSLNPVDITVPAAVPVISDGNLTRTGNSLQVVLSGLSSTRGMTEAEFHFLPVSGKSLGTTDLTVPLTPAFQAWYQSTASDAFGTTFTYTQPFTISGDAADIQSVTVTLTNSQGVSESTTLQ